jgi:hypothetical protein
MPQDQQKTQNAPNQAKMAKKSSKLKNSTPLKLAHPNTLNASSPP